MKTLFAFLLFAVITISSCQKPDCGCTPPPHTETNWKITSRIGGISGGPATLTADQQNNILTISTAGTFSSRNTATGAVVSGTIAQSDYSSIYGLQTRLVFTPNLPMLNEEFHIIVEHSGAKLRLGDNKTDGYITTFEIIP